MNPKKTPRRGTRNGSPTLIGCTVNVEGRFDPIVAAKRSIEGWLLDIRARFGDEFADCCTNLMIRDGTPECLLNDRDWRLSNLEAVILEREPMVSRVGIIYHLRFRYGEVVAHIGANSLDSLLKVFPTWEVFPAKLARQIVDAILAKAGVAAKKSNTPHLDLFTENRAR